MTTFHPQRRSLLAGLFAVPVVAAAPAIAAQAAPIATESPELLALGERLPDIAARIHGAKARLEEALATYERLTPALPPEIVAEEGERGDLTTIDRDLNGEATPREVYGFWLLYDSRKLRAHIILRDISRHTKEGRRIRRIARLAARFEKAREAALMASGYSEASNAMWSLRIELQDDFAKAALELKPASMKGIGIYAAIIALGSGPACHAGRPVGYCEPLGIAMAEAFAALTGADPMQLNTLPGGAQ